MIGDDVEDALDEVREVAHGLYPPPLADSGSSWRCRRSSGGLRCRSPSTPTASPLLARLESAVYYCCLEAIQNASKHGGPDVRITVTLRQHGDELRFDVKDDGPGFDAERATGAGLQNMRDRLGALGGRLTVRTAPGEGTLVSGRLPRSTRINP